MKAQDASGAVALIVEDEALLAMATEDVLRAENFKALLAYTEVEARSLMSAQLAVAVVSIDLDGDHAGPRIIRQLRAVRPNLPIVVVSGYEKSGPKADLRGLGGPIIRLMKPVSPGELTKAIRDVIERDRNDVPPRSGRRRSDSGWREDPGFRAFGRRLEAFASAPERAYDRADANEADIPA